VKASDK